MRRPPDILRAARLTLPGRLLLALGLALLVAGVLPSLRTLLAPGVACIALAIGAWAAAVLNISRLYYTRETPALVARGATFRAVLTLANLKPLLGGFGLHVQDELPHSGLRRSERLPDVLPATLARAEFDLRIDRRGLFRAMGVRLVSNFPLFLAHAERPVAALPPLWVYPPPAAVPWLEQLLAWGSGPGGWNAAPSDGPGEFRALREYRPGDPVGLITWPCSARRRRLILKETEQPTPQHLLLVFHSFTPPGAVLTRLSYEEALDQLSGIFHGLSEHGVPFEFCAPFTGWDTRSATPGDTASIEGLLIALADAEMQTSRDLHAVNAACRRATPPINAIWVISNTPCRYWRDALRPAALPLAMIDRTGPDVRSAAHAQLP